ncbi:anthranilate phosphoribosyltransferase [Prolixibacteraceae bacterium JC049]|nr:anthranilate phosphoribosyltransferase [Prolixibacteraceae bacterium JC049]
MKAIIKQLIRHKTLNRSVAKEVLVNIANGKYNDAEIAAFLGLYMMRPANVDELSGFRDALLELCVAVDFSEFNTIDLCGTGGDGKDTFNISTLASLVVAGAGERVAKHGNYGVSSVCGSSNVMEFLGYEFSNDQEKLKSSLDKAGFVYLHAPFFHPAMKAVGGIRRDLGMKTFFNILGPMVNPSSPKNQLVGVFDLETMRLYNYMFQQSNKNFTILHSLDGYDEISLTDSFRSVSNGGEQLIAPADLGFSVLKEADLAGGKNIEESAKLFVDILKGAGTEAQSSVVVANAALALKTMNSAADMGTCLERAERALKDRKGYDVLKQITQK